MMNEPREETRPACLKGFQARRAGNGGWVVESVEHEGRVPTIIGAFTNASDMVEFLKSNVQ